MTWRKQAEAKTPAAIVADTKASVEVWADDIMITASLIDAVARAFPDGCIQRSQLDFLTEHLRTVGKIMFEDAKSLDHACAALGTP